MADFLGGLLGGGIDFLATGFLTSLGMKLKNKDSNATGVDDAAGNALVAIAPLIPAIIHGDIKGQRKVVQASIAALTAYQDALGAIDG